MKLIILLLLLFLFWITYRNPKYGLISILLLFSLGGIIDQTFSSTYKYITFGLIFVIEILGVNKNLINPYFIFIEVVIILKEIVTYLNSGSLQSLMMGVIYYSVLPSIVYFIFLRIKNDPLCLIKQLKIFIIVCLCIQYYRAFFDITFFGYVQFDFDLDKYSDLMVLGSESFRPSSIESCIIYSIELSTVLSLLIFYEGINKKNCMILFFGLIGIIMTLSRSGLLIFSASIFYYLLKNKKYGLIMILAIAMTGLFISLGFVDRLIEMVDFNSNTYQIRTNSINNVLSQISNFDIITFLFGNGMGSAFTGGEIVTGHSFYVENFFLYTLINSGVLGLIIIVYVCARSIRITYRTNKEFCQLLCTIVFTNFLACNLSAYCVEILFLLICFISGLMKSQPKIVNYGLIPTHIIASQNKKIDNDIMNVING